MKASPWKRSIAALMAAGLVFAACGSDDNGDTTPAQTDAPAGTEATEGTDAAPEETDAAPEATDGEDMAGGEELALEGEVEIAAGTTLNLDDCPSDWDPYRGVDGDEIRIGQSLPQSGPAAAFGPIGEGMQMYFDYLNDNDPIDGKDLVLIARDDAYEAGRTVANVEEMIDTEDIFAFADIIGTSNNLAVRPITDEGCVPQLFNSTGFPLWGDPANFPWTIGNILNYVTETNIWCTAIVDEFGEGASVAALIMNNDFGATYQSALEACAADGQIDLVEVQVHDQAAPDITNEMTTLASSGADVFVAGTTGAFCPQSVASVAATEWRPRFYMSYTCNNLASFFAPVQDQAALLAEEGSGVRVTNSNKVCGDAAYADDPAIQLTVQVLDEYGNGTTCADGSYSTGVLFAQVLEDVLRSAAAMPGGLNRVNLMAAVWNMDTTNGQLVGDGVIKTDGVNDAFVTESAQISEVVVTDGNLGFNPIGDVIDLEGQGGSYQGG